MIDHRDELMVVCSCSTLSHAVRFAFWTDEHQDDFEAYVDVCLIRTTLWNRIKIAWSYLLNRTCGFGEVSEIVLRKEDLGKLRAWLDRADELVKR